MCSKQMDQIDQSMVLLQSRSPAAVDRWTSCSPVAAGRPAGAATPVEAWRHEHLREEQAKAGGRCYPVEARRHEHLREEQASSNGRSRGRH